MSDYRKGYDEGYTDAVSQTVYLLKSGLLTLATKHSIDMRGVYILIGTVESEMRKGSGKLLSPDDDPANQAFPTFDTEKPFEGFGGGSNGSGK